jgi:DNA-directed RNA polymerase specialized sigma24 family protein
MSSNGIVYEMYHAMVKQIGSEFKRKYQMVEREDIEQQLWLWFAEHPNKIDEWLALPDQKDRDKLFARSLRNSALDYCIKEKAHKSGYNAEDNFWYNKQFIKLMIPAVLSDDWTKFNNTLSNMGRTSKALAESGDFMAFSSDVMVAFDKLNDREKSLVRLFYGEQIDGAELRERMDADKSQKAVMMEANRAVNKMVKILGGNPPVRDEDYHSNT